MANTGLLWRSCILFARHQLAVCTQITPPRQNFTQTACSWRRPKDPPIPKIWRRCTGRVKYADSTPYQFRIQDVPEDMFDTVIAYLTKELMRDEPMFKALGLERDPISLEEIQELWREMLHQRVSLVAMLDEPGIAKPTIAGCNILCVADKSSTSAVPKLKGSASRRLMEALHYVESTADVFSRYGVSHYLTGMGLAVGMDYRGRGLGAELLRARLKLGRELNIPLTVTLFSGPVSQAVARQVGMNLLVESPYDQFKIGGEVVFPDTPGSFRLMAKRIE